MGTVVYRVGHDVSTDAIYPGRFMATVLPSETPQFAFADEPINARLKKGEVPAGSVVVGGRNFGCGSSREQAVSTLKGWELTVVADEIEVLAGKIVNRTTGKEFPASPLPPSRQAIMDAGGLIVWTRQRLLADRPA